MGGHRGRAWPTRRALCGGLALLPALGLRPLRADDDPSSTDWVVGDHARVRLIDAGPAAAGAARRLAGIEIELDPGYLTYWRSPGEAGVPPTLDTTGSLNLKTATLLFPAPRRYSEGGTEAFGYKEAVLFPILLDAADPGKPIDLHAALSFAICERQCLPASATMRLVLAGDGRSPEADLVRQALARVPAAAKVGDPGPLAVTALKGAAGDDELTVLAHTDGTEVPSLFADAPEPWFVQADAGVWLNDGTLKYVVKVLAKPPEPAALPLRLTLVGGDHAVEVPVTLDAPKPKP